jgi:hypothetical protein
MAGFRRLVCWIGNADLLAMANELPPAEKDRVLTALKARDNPGAKTGPIRTLLTNEAFDEIHLLSNYQPFLAEYFVRWLGSLACIHQIEIASPTDYASIFRAVDTTLASIVKEPAGPGAELCIHLSPGSPAMVAIWVLLGKSRYPATFFQTHEGRAWKTEIPFDLAFDFVPELLQSSDLSFQHLASRSP